MSVMRSKTLFHAFCFSVVLLFSNMASAALITLSGADFGSDFDLTYDDTQLSLFGVPQISNNTIFFAPSEFSAQSLDGLSAAEIISEIVLTLVPHNDLMFDSFSLVERGDYLLSGAGASVDVFGTMRVNNVEDPAEVTTSQIVANTALNSPGFHNWEASAFIDTTTSGDWKSSVDAAVELAIENVLIASTQQMGELAFIEKKFIGSPVALKIGTVSIAEPATLGLLFVSSIMTVLLIRRRAS